MYKKIAIGFITLIPALSQHVYASDFNIMGVWSGSPDCSVVFTEDDGEDVFGNCDNNSYKHAISGSYVGKNNIRITVTRTDPAKCTTSVSGHIKIRGKNNLIFSQKGWNGCGVSTSTGTQHWSRD